VGSKNNLSGKRNVILASNTKVKGDNNIIFTDNFNSNTLANNKLESTLVLDNWIASIDKTDLIPTDLYNVIRPAK
jgi:hypothetical protein